VRAVAVESRGNPNDPVRESRLDALLQQMKRVLFR
jgi:hypothetical protein